MRSGKQPFITYESVRAALEAMLYTSTAPPPNPLEELSLVDQFISNPDLPSIVNSREFALRQLLLSIITQEYSQHRHNFGLAAPVLNMPFEAAAADIRRDVQQQNPELNGWCLLYYRYVRVDLDLSIETITTVANIEQRTLRRYQNHATIRLQECLVEAEWEARTKQRKTRLYASLPISIPISLVGRGDTLQYVQRLLSSSPIRHFQVTGPPGIGKTALVQELVRQQIDVEQINQVIWIDNPESVDFVRHTLNEMLLNDLNTRLREYTLRHNLAVVLDHLHGVDEVHVADWQHLLSDLSAALVFVTSRVYIPLLQSVKHITLKELGEADALALVENSIDLGEDDDFDREYARRMVSEIGGNPYALTLAARNFSIYHLSTSHESVLDDVFNQSYNALDKETRIVWLLFALCPAGELPVYALTQLWSSLFTQERAMTLLRHYLVQRGQKIDHYALPTSSRHFILAKYINAPTVLDTLIEEVHDGLSKGIPFAFDVIEHLLLSDWLRVQPEKARMWISVSLGDALRRGHCAQWVTIIENFQKRHGKTDLSIQIGLGMCLRRVSRWSRAFEVLEQAISDAGRTGQFQDQGRALLELGILYRQQGYYEKAGVIMEKAQDIFSRYHNHERLTDLLIERTQAALDRGDAKQAQDYLRDLPETGRILAMESEVHLLLGDYRGSLDLANRAILLSTDNPLAIGRLYAMMGRIFDQQNELENAANYFAHAITILEREGDLWALARAQSNFGALLIRQENAYEAYEALSKAENIQVVLGDRVGLESTRHNFRVLRRRFGG